MPSALIHSECLSAMGLHCRARHRFCGQTEYVVNVRLDYIWCNLTHNPISKYESMNHDCLPSAEMGWEEKKIPTAQASWRFHRNLLPISELAKRREYDLPNFKCTDKEYYTWVLTGKHLIADCYHDALFDPPSHETWFRWLTKYGIWSAECIKL